MAITAVQGVLVVATLLVATGTVSWAQLDDEVPTEWLPEQFPSPRLRPHTCGLGQTPGYVCDPNHILTRRDLDIVAWLLDRFYRNDTKCPCSAWSCEQNNRGYHLSIAIVQKLRVPRDTAVLDQAYNFVYHLANGQWQFGYCEENIIVLYSKDDNVLYAITGETARRKLPPAMMDNVFAQVGWRFQPNEDVSIGFFHLIKVLKEVLLDNRHFIMPYEPQAEAIRSGGTTLAGSTVLGLLCALLALVL